MLGGKNMVDNKEIRQMLEKANAQPFYYGSDDVSYFWRVATIDGELYAERSYCDGEGVVSQSYYFALPKDKGAWKNIYDDIVIDFVAYYSTPWLCRSAHSVFEGVASEKDEGLMEILAIFGKKYADFLNDVMYWFSIALASGENYQYTYVISDNRTLDDDERLVKIVLKRFEKSEPMIIALGDTFYYWKIAKCNDQIWYSRTTQHCRDYYVSESNEYGHMSLYDEDAIGALRDAILACSNIEGWELVKADENLENTLSLVGIELTI
jgi:hypothetical protein